MNSLEPYNLIIDNLIKGIGKYDQSNPCDHKIEYHLNGGTDEFIQKEVNKEDLKASGIFFTDKKRGAYLAGKIVNSSRPADKLILDPTCGAGDLLLSCARLLPIKSTLESTLAYWGKILHGYDIHSSLIQIAKKRLILLASYRTKEQFNKSNNHNDYFRGIKAGNFLKTEALKSDFDIIANPPFHSQKAPNEYPFSRGDTNSAALILYKCLELLPSNCRIATVLPDVIRSGSRYKKLILHTNLILKNQKIRIESKFSKTVDVDVITLYGQKRKHTKKLVVLNNENKPTLQNWFKVSVGSSVPHRHIALGDNYPFITAKDIKISPIRNEDLNHIQCSTTVFKAPFVVMRRTSSPSDTNRLFVVLVSGEDLYAVENHVLVIKPKDNQDESCVKLLSYLKSETCLSWLNQRIRCRHFTVAAIKEIPYNHQNNDT